MSTALDDKTQKVFEEIKTLSFLQTASLVKAFEEEFGISAAAPVAVAAVAAAAPAEAAEEASEVTLILVDAGANKINVLKEVRAITGLGLKEAKDLVDTANSTIKAGIKPDDAKAMAAKLTEQGAKVEIK